MPGDACQKYSQCPEKAVCGVTAACLPRTLTPPPSLTLRDSIQPKKSVLHSPCGGEAASRSRQEGSSAALRWDKGFSSCSLSSPHSYCPHNESRRLWSVSEDSHYGPTLVHKHQLTNSTAVHHFSINHATVHKKLLMKLQQFPVIHTQKHKKRTQWALNG